jgi:Asp-tRNA(Asn)/Glu-tRNA(Gln) amidotransferase A subunit family amidase
MRFGKTFTTYQLAKSLGAKRVIVVTFKPAVEDAWQTDLESHADFNGWQYLSRSSGSDPTQIDRKKPVVYFGSFQDLLGRDAAGNIKPKNEWLHTVNWDLVVFDEYHFGAWRDTAKELFEGEEEAIAKKEAKLEYAGGLEDMNEDLAVARHVQRHVLKHVLPQCSGLLLERLHARQDGAFRGGDNADDPLAMYLADLLTIPANLAGLPAISLPCGFDDASLPIGVQLITGVLQEERLLQVAHHYEQAAAVMEKRPEGQLIR